MAAELPQQIKVGGFLYPVRCEEADREYLDSHSAWGMTRESPRRVLIDAGADLQRKQEVLIHEVLHLCAHNSGLDATWGKAEEEYVNRMALTLFQVFTDNPTVVRYFLNEEPAQAV